MGAWLAEQDWYRVLKKHRRIGGLRLRLYLLVFSNLISYMYMYLFFRHTEIQGVPFVEMEGWISFHFAMLSCKVCMQPFS